MFDKKTSKGIKAPCLILSNHQTSFDVFAVGIGFKFGINYVGSDSIQRGGIKGWLTNFLVRPIPFSKGSTDSTAIRHIFSIIKRGGIVGLFASGNMSFFGDECTLKPGLGKLSQKLGVPVIIVNLRGGYNTKPRWKTKPNKGKMTGSVTRIISVEELKTLTHEQLDEIIIKELSFNEFEWNRREQIVFHGRQKAENLEIFIFYCPQCSSINTVKSKGNDFFCNSCTMRVTINGTGFFEKIKMAEKCPDTILEWSKLQLEHIKSIDYSQCIDKPLFSDDNVRLYFVVSLKKTKFVGQGKISLYGDKITVCGQDFPVEKIKDMAIQKMYKLTIYTEEGVYDVDFPKLKNVMKYMVCGYHLRNTALNIEDSERVYGY
jgi:1-acyl-sn-glycerol-3-phosphate acyltransferase